MSIKVIYENDALAEIEPFLLDELIALNRIKKLFRSDGWATVGTDPIRGRDRRYEGNERRKNPVFISPRLSQHLELSEGLADERRRLEQELLKLQKLESVGVLAGGIAHDFNNLLTGILANISLARIVPQDKIYERLVEAEKAAVRAKDLTRQLLTFSKGGAPVRKTIFPESVIRDSVALSSSGRKAICEVLMPDDLWPIDADEGQISQAINNLIINADHAMPEGGKIIVSCENIEIGECCPLPLRSGKYITIVVKDEGIGIPEENLGKIFDPFFTTKDKGTGLGLATTYTIIKNHEGHIAVESTLKSGTAFIIYLPASESQTTVRKPWEVQVKPGKGKILIMDDEEIIRQVSCEMLKYMGYEVECAEDGPGAIEMYTKALKSGSPFDVVIMDLTIPGGMGGKETIEKLLETDPAVRAIVSSGYSNNHVMSNFRDFGFVGKMEKPFKIGELSVQIRKVINGHYELF